MGIIDDRCEYFPRITRRIQYRDGKIHPYSSYRHEIQEDCKRRCVYCDAHEEEIGGDAMFHLDHFRPQDHFPLLINTPTNLVWSCSRCNLLKRNHWPALGLGDDVTIKGNLGFVDPFDIDRNDYFLVKNDGHLESRQIPAQYLIEKLALNRPFLKLNRLKRRYISSVLVNLEGKETWVIEKLEELRNKLNEVIEDEQRSLLEELRESYMNYLLLVREFREMVLILL